MNRDQSWPGIRASAQLPGPKEGSLGRFWLCPKTERKSVLLLSEFLVWETCAQMQSTTKQERDVLSIREPPFLGAFPFPNKPNNKHKKLMDWRIRRVLFFGLSFLALLRITINRVCAKQRALKENNKKIRIEREKDANGRRTNRAMTDWRTANHQRQGVDGRFVLIAVFAVLSLPPLVAKHQIQRELQI